MSRVIPSFFSWQKFASYRRLFFLCLLLFVSSAFLSLWLFFPADVLQQRLIQKVSQQTGVEMRGRNAGMLFPMGLELDLSIYPEIPGLNDLELTGLQISPVWRSFFSTDQKVNLVGALAAGEIDVDAGKSGQINLKLRDISLLALQQPDMPYRLGGKLTGQLDGKNVSQEMNGRGSFSFYLSDTRVLGLEKIGLPGNFSAGVLRLKGKFDQRRISLEEVVLTGGDLELSGGGNILIGGTSEQTRLNLNVRLHPTSTTPESLQDLLHMTGIRPTADGSYLLRIGGSLTKPIIR
ncbi:MAG: type II secretion system protein GspN [Desulfuromusa sp.]